MDDVTQCKTDIPGEGCGLVFPKKTSPGKCQKCLALDREEDPDSPRSKAMMV